jgi:hypothetical protein
MSALTIVDVALTIVLVIAAVVNVQRQRVDFLSSRQYHARNLGFLLLLIAAALSFAYSDLGYSKRFVAIAAAIVACVGCGFFFWGVRGHRPQAKP